MTLKLQPLKKENKEMFIKDLQAAFNELHAEKLGVTENTIPTEDIEKSLATKNAKSYHIIRDNEIIGGVIVNINESQKNKIDYLYKKVGVKGHGVGKKTLELIEEKFPETKVWELYTPYFNEKNIHFYVNTCGFKIVEFFNKNHRSDEFPIGDLNFFRFEKVMK